MQTRNTQCHPEKKNPIIVGGSYFYIDALLHGLLKEPTISPELRLEVKHLPEGELGERLKKIDPISTEKIHPQNTQRLRRALLVSLASGEPFSSFKREGGILSDYFIHAWSLDIPRKLLYERINLRCQKMLANGWIQETKSLLEKGYRMVDSPGLQSLGYKEIVEFLKKYDLNPKQSKDSKPCKSKTRRAL